MVRGVRKIFGPAGGGFVLTGSCGEGRRGGRRVEADRERERVRGGPWARRGVAAAWYRRGSDLAAARAGVALPRDSGGRRGRRDA
jgi:hypothetical protein